MVGNFRSAILATWSLVCSMYNVGVAVPSLTSFVYYAVFLVLLVIWSVHLRLAGLVRVLRTLLTLHSALHLLVLHLFQFSAAQDQIQLGPCPMPDSNDYCNTTNSLLARSVHVIILLSFLCSWLCEALQDQIITVHCTMAFAYCTCTVSSQ